MSRRNAAIVREVLPDSKYNSVIVTKLINQVMEDGKKGIAQNIVYDAFDLASEKLSVKPMDLFNQALENIKPLLETKARRVGAATYQVPMEIRPERRQTLAIRWLILFAQKRTSERTMKNKLAAELVDAYNGAGGAVKRRDEMHRQAEANKAFAHYRW
ncbi:MAG: 30S ribosomal protein S7 [Clostridia bacterium]|nr:30S ribosomal protein S7 [Clostridia bacterium]